jgi:signal transduction histidine kinase
MSLKERPLLGRKTLLVGIILLPAMGLYFVFDFYLASVGKELFLSWYQSQAVEIQEGNLLSAISKNQRVLLSSSFIRGIELIDLAQTGRGPLIEIGARFDPLDKDGLPIGQPVVKNVGFLHKQVALRPPNRPEVVVVFDVESKFLQIAFALTSGAVILFYALLRLFELREFARRGGFIRQALDEFLSQERPSALIEQEFPSLVVWWRQKMKALEESRQKEIEHQKLKVLSEMAAQVSHDIRSPLSALNMMLGSLNELPEEKRLIVRSATQRINDIANTLLSSGQRATKSALNGTSDQVSEPIMLVALLDEIVSEKRTQFRARFDVEIHGELNSGYGLFAEINPTEFMRMISNLVNNSVESIDGRGRIVIGISPGNLESVITVRDTGKGMPASLIARLGERGLSEGKRDNSNGSGSGLGLYHARKTVEAAGGRVEIESIIGEGTLVILRLPRAKTPSWFLERLVVKPDTIVVTADDDQTIHQVWKERLTLAGVPLSQHINFSSLATLEQWATQNKSENVIFLIDFEFLGEKRNGLDVIETCGIASRTVLVTSRFSEPLVRRRADSLGVRLLPKGLAPIVPVVFGNMSGEEQSCERFDAILVDDDSLQHLSWQVAAKERGHTLICFSNPDEFYARAARIDINSPLYIDVTLANGARGEDVASRASEMGFKEIYLATGYAPEMILAPSCVRQVVGKDPRFDDYR